MNGKAEEERIMRERDDLAYLKNCGMWPRWPYCPVKNQTNETIRKERKDSFPVCGVVFDENPLGKGGPIWATPTVYLLNIFAGWTAEQFKECKKYEYESLEAMVADGWVID